MCEGWLGKGKTATFQAVRGIGPKGAWGREAVRGMGQGGCKGHGTVMGQGGCKGHGAERL